MRKVHGRQVLGRLAVGLGFAATLGTIDVAGVQTAAEPTLDTVLERMGTYVAGWGEQASLIVAVESYVQRASYDDGRPSPPRTLLAEFAVVKTAARENDWTGYRDVFEVDGTQIPDRATRLLALFSQRTTPADLLRRIDAENARFNVGPIFRNINVPTTALYFLHPSRRSRLTFAKVRNRTIDGHDTWEISFKESRMPTVIRTRAGADVPVDGTVWVMAGDGTIVRTRLRLRGFADDTTRETSEVRRTEPAPPPPPPPPTTGSGGASAAQANLGTILPPREVVTRITETVRIESRVDIEVTYGHHTDVKLWVPTRMSELYEGPIRSGAGNPVRGRVETTASYRDFKRFTTDVRITDVK